MIGSQVKKFINAKKEKKMKSINEDQVDFTDGGRDDMRRGGFIIDLCKNDIDS